MQLKRASMILFVICAISLMGMPPPVAGQEEPAPVAITDLKVEPGVLRLVEGQNGTLAISFAFQNRMNVSLGNLSLWISLEPPGTTLVGKELPYPMEPGETCEENYTFDIGQNIAAGIYNLTVSIYCRDIATATVEKQNFTIIRLKPACIGFLSFHITPEEIKRLKPGQNAHFQIYMLISNSGDLNGTFYVSIYEAAKNNKRTYIIVNRTVNIEPQGNWNTTLNWSTATAGNHALYGEVWSLNGTREGAVYATCTVRYVKATGANDVLFPNELALVFGLIVVISIVAAFVIIFLAGRYA